MVLGNNINQIHNHKWNERYGLCSLSGLFSVVVSFVVDVAYVLKHASTPCANYTMYGGPLFKLERREFKKVITYGRYS